ncbi:hypothetical protein K438DRAFT_2024051 [Mycena galopus ATCC 62051]|nr:hypothetical protein K438DRAFT_2024051 [Mycena galopus ATCC 62051]
MALLPDVSLSYGPMLIGVFINLILYGVFLWQALTHYQWYCGMQTELTRHARILGGHVTFEEMGSDGVEDRGRAALAGQDRKFRVRERRFPACPKIQRTVASPPPLRSVFDARECNLLAACGRLFCTVRRRHSVLNISYSRSPHRSPEAPLHVRTTCGPVHRRLHGCARTGIATHRPSAVSSSHGSVIHPPCMGDLSLCTTASPRVLQACHPIPAHPLAFRDAVLLLMACVSGVPLTNAPACGLAAADSFFTHPTPYDMVAPSHARGSPTHREAPRYQCAHGVSLYTLCTLAPRELSPRSLIRSQGLGTVFTSRLRALSATTRRLDALSSPQPTMCLPPASVSCTRERHSLPRVRRLLRLGSSCFVCTLKAPLLGGPAFVTSRYTARIRGRTRVHCNHCRGGRPLAAAAERLRRTRVSFTLSCVGVSSVMRDGVTRRRASRTSPALLSGGQSVPSLMLLSSFLLSWAASCTPEPSISALWVHSTDLSARRLA